MEVEAIHMSFTRRIIVLMEKGLASHADDLGLGCRIRILDKINNGGDGIAHDLAFGPAESDSESL